MDYVVRIGEIAQEVSVLAAHANCLAFWPHHTLGGSQSVTQVQIVPTSSSGLHMHCTNMDHGHMLRQDTPPTTIIVNYKKNLHSQTHISKTNFVKLE